MPHHQGEEEEQGCEMKGEEEGQGEVVEEEEVGGLHQQG